VITQWVNSRIKVLKTLSLTGARIMKSLQQSAGIVLLMAAVATGAAAQGARARGNPLVGPAATQTVPSPAREEQNVSITREQLHRVLSQYPPSLERVLQLDPSLLQNPEYLGPYPVLAEYLSQHPEIAHNPAYFLGVGEPYIDRENSFTETYRLWRDVSQGLAIFLSILTAVMLFAWLVRTLIDYRRWHRLSKIQTDVHTKLLDRFNSNEDLLAYIQSPSGKRFLESAPIPVDIGPRSINAPIGRIMWSVQTGLVLAFAGIGLYFAFSQLSTEKIAEPFFVVSVLAVALGLGFIASAGVSYALSQRLGLFVDPSVRATNRNTETST
jgi:hypothetical protein